MLLIGCPAPPEAPSNSGPAAAGAPGGGPPPAGPGAGEPGAPAAGQPAGEGAPADGANAPEGERVEPATDLSSIITGKTIKLTGKIEGADTVQISVLAPGPTPQDMPAFLAMLSVTDGKFKLELPETYDKALYFTAVSDVTGDGPSDDDLSGVSDPVKPAGKDLAITIKLSKDKSWTKKMPWQAPDQADMGAAPPPGPTNPPKEGEAAPAGEAPGAPPAGAPAAGAAAPPQ